MKAVPTAAGDAFKLNTGSPKLFHDVEKEVAQWMQGGTKASKEAARYVREGILEAKEPFKLDPTTGQSKFYASGDALHDAIKALNTRISGAYDMVSAPGGKSQIRMNDARVQLEKLRDHLHDLWENTDAGSYAKLRKVDVLSSAMQTVQDAGALAAKNKMGYTPEQLIQAGKSGQPSRATARSRNDLQDYAMNMQDVLGPSLAEHGAHTNLPALSILGTSAALAHPAVSGALGAPWIGAALGHPAMAAAGLGGASALTQMMYRRIPGLGQSAGTAWANSSPWRLGQRDVLNKLPGYLGAPEADAKP